MPDYRDINKIITKNKFPSPNIDDLLYEIHGGAYFTKLDIKLRYHQIRLREKYTMKTTFLTHQGHYEFLVMPFGWTNFLSNF